MNSYPIDSFPYGTPGDAKDLSQTRAKKRDQKSLEMNPETNKVSQSKRDAPETTGLSLVERMELEEMTHPSDSGRRRPLARLPGYGYD